MKTKNNLFDDMFMEELEDIISTGFYDTLEEGIEYIADMNILYLEFKYFLIRLESIENFSRLSIKREEKIRQEFIDDEDMKFAFARLHNIVFRMGEMDTVRIEKICLYNLNTNDSEIICDAMKICLSSGQVLFFDPTYYFGINIGDETLIPIWEDQHKNYTVTIVDKNTSERA